MNSVNYVLFIGYIEVLWQLFEHKIVWKAQDSEKLD